MADKNTDNKPEVVDVDINNMHPLDLYNYSSSVISLNMMREGIKTRAKNPSLNTLTEDSAAAKGALDKGIFSFCRMIDAGGGVNKKEKYTDLNIASDFLGEVLTRLAERRESIDPEERYKNAGSREAKLQPRKYYIEKAITILSDVRDMVDTLKDAPTETAADKEHLEILKEKVKKLSSSMDYDKAEITKHYATVWPKEDIMFDTGFAIREILALKNEKQFTENYGGINAHFHAYTTKEALDMVFNVDNYIERSTAVLEFDPVKASQMVRGLDYEEEPYIRKLLGNTKITMPNFADPIFKPKSSVVPNPVILSRNFTSASEQMELMLSTLCFVLDHKDTVKDFKKPYDLSYMGISNSKDFFNRAKHEYEHVLRSIEYSPDIPEGIRKEFKSSSEMDVVRNTVLLLTEFSNLATTLQTKADVEDVDKAKLEKFKEAATNIRRIFGPDIKEAKKNPVLGETTMAGQLILKMVKGNRQHLGDIDDELSMKYQIAGMTAYSRLMQGVDVYISSTEALAKFQEKKELEKMVTPQYGGSIWKPTLRDNMKLNSISANNNFAKAATQLEVMLSTFCFAMDVKSAAEDFDKPYGANHIGLANTGRFLKSLKQELEKKTEPVDATGAGKTYNPQGNAIMLVDEMSAIVDILQASAPEHKFDPLRFEFMKGAWNNIYQVLHNHTYGKETIEGELPERPLQEKGNESPESLLEAMINARHKSLSIDQGNDLAGLQKIYSTRALGVLVHGLDIYMETGETLLKFGEKQAPQKIIRPQWSIDAVKSITQDPKITLNAFNLGNQIVKVRDQCDLNLSNLCFVLDDNKQVDDDFKTYDSRYLGFDNTIRYLSEVKQGLIAVREKTDPNKMPSLKVEETLPKVYYLDKAINLLTELDNIITIMRVDGAKQAIDKDRLESLKISAQNLKDIFGPDLKTPVNKLSRPMEEETLGGIHILCEIIDIKCKGQLINFSLDLFDNYKTLSMVCFTKFRQDMDVYVETANALLKFEQKSAPQKPAAPKMTTPQWKGELFKPSSADIINAGFVKLDMNFTKASDQLSLALSTLCFAIDPKSSEEDLKKPYGPEYLGFNNGMNFFKGIRSDIVEERKKIIDPEELPKVGGPLSVVPRRLHLERTDTFAGVMANITDIVRLITYSQFDKELLEELKRTGVKSADDKEQLDMLKKMTGNLKFLYGPGEKEDPQGTTRWGSYMMHEIVSSRYKGEDREKMLGNTNAWLRQEAYCAQAYGRFQDSLDIFVGTFAALVSFNEKEAAKNADKEKKSILERRREYKEFEADKTALPLSSTLPQAATLPPPPPPRVFFDDGRVVHYADDKLNGMVNGVTGILNQDKDKKEYAAKAVLFKPEPASDPIRFGTERVLYSYGEKNISYSEKQEQISTLEFFRESAHDVLSQIAANIPWHKELAEKICSKETAQLAGKILFPALTAEPGAKDGNEDLGIHGFASENLKKIKGNLPKSNSSDAFEFLKLIAANEAVLRDAIRYDNIAKKMAEIKRLPAILTQHPRMLGYMQNRSNETKGFAGIIAIHATQNQTKNIADMKEFTTLLAKHPKWEEAFLTMNEAQLDQNIKLVEHIKQNPLPVIFAAGSKDHLYLTAKRVMNRLANNLPLDRCYPLDTGYFRNILNNMFGNDKELSRA